MKKLDKATYILHFLFIFATNNYMNRTGFFISILTIIFGTITTLSLFSMAFMVEGHGEGLVGASQTQSNCPLAPVMAVSTLCTDMGGGAAVTTHVSVMQQAFGMVQTYQGLLAALAVVMVVAWILAGAGAENIGRRHALHRTSRLTYTYWMKRIADKRIATWQRWFATHFGRNPRLILQAYMI